MQRLTSAFLGWLPLAVAVTGICLLVYATVQQSLRQGANDPQIQMAEDAAAALKDGASAQSVIPAAQVEISRSLAPFLILYDKQGGVAESSGLLNGQPPDFPMGALEAAADGGENRVTWQPASAVRIASVVVSYKGGYVVAGRNLREVESREAQTKSMTAIAWLVTLVAVFFAMLIVRGD